MRKLSVLVLALCFTVPSAWAQTTTAQINGTLTDQSGAVVPGAAVTATNVATNEARSTSSNQNGQYTLPFLPPGNYELKAEAKGFSTVLQKNVGLLVGQVATLNLVLRPGGANETVEVSGAAPLVETSRSDVGGSVTPTEVTNLPVLDRNFANLMQLVPGVRPAPNFDPTKSRSGNVTVNGGDGRAFDYNVDGGDNKDNVIGGIVQNFTLEGIQEFNVVTDRYGADSGRTVGGVVNVVTKSGTNKLHGSLFSQFQLSTLNAASAFDRTAGPDGQLFTADDQPLPKDNYHRYHFGGSVGGPIKKDKLFFFGAYEYKRELAGIKPDPNAVQELALVPFAAPAAKITTPFFDHLITVKLDAKINDKQSMFFRYGRERWITLNDQPGVNVSTISDLTESNSNINQFHSAVLQHTYSLSSNKVNVAAMQFQDFVNAIDATPGRTFTLPVAGGGVATNPLITFPSAELGQNGNVPQQTLIRKYQFRDDFSWTVGRHNMKFGANWIYLAKLGGFFFFGANGYEVDFLKDPSQLPGGLATPGAVGVITFSSGDGRTDNPQAPHSLGLYYQDDFKVTPHLTLNLGLRWDANIHFLPPQFTPGDPLHTNRTIAVLQQLVAANPSGSAAADGLARAQYLVGNSDNLTKTTADWKEFQPRVGFAWDPTGAGKMAIRGGYGIARDQVFQNLTLFSLQQAHPLIYQTLIDLEGSDLSTFRFGVDPLPAPAPGLTTLAKGAVGRINDPFMTDPWSQQMSVGMSYQMASDYAFSADYYHVLGTHEPRVLNDNPQLAFCKAGFPGANPADPRCVRGASTRLMDAAFVAAGIPAGQLGEIRNVATNNRSLFDSFNLQLKKRMTHNFMFQASYVLSWSRAWGGRPTSSYGGTSLAIPREVEFLPSEFGPTDFDERHRVVISGVFNLSHGFELSPIFQASSARPVNFRSGTDINGDGRTTLDRVCAGSTINNIITTPGCDQVQVNSMRGFAFINLDLSAAKRFKLGETSAVRLFWEFHNLTNRFNKCNALFNNSSSSNFLQPIQGPISGPYCSAAGGSGGFGPGFSTPYRSQFGLRFEF